MQPSILHRLFWGIVLVAAGVVFLLNQTDVIAFDVGDLFKNFWPAFIILFGLQGLLIQRSGGYLWNIIVILVGVIFLGRNLGWFEWNLRDLFSLIGPVVLILFGIGMIAKGAKPRRDRGDNDRQSYGWNPVTPPPVPNPPAPPQGPPPAPPLTDDPNASFTGQEFSPPPPPKSETEAAPTAGAPVFRDHRHDHGHARHYERIHERMERKEERLRERMERREERWKQRHQHHNWSNCDPNASQHHRFIGDVHIGHDYWELRPMNISHFIGDTTLDLTKAQIPLGETKIYVSCFIGDVKVFVPNDLSVGVQVVSSSLIGDVRVWDHKRGGFFNHMSVETPSYSDTDKRVVLIASAFIGDVRVTKVG